MMENDFSRIAALIGDPVRATILWSLLDGRAYTATELANNAETSPQNISMHLAKLLKAELLSVEVQGRHRYYTFSRAEVADAIEAMASLVPAKRSMPAAAATTNAANANATAAAADLQPIRFCRTCYDHLAGKVGVLVTESLLQQKLIHYKDKAFALTTKGLRWFTEWGIDCEALQQQRRSFSKPCLDWTERKHHLAGSLGAALLQKMMEEQWCRKIAHSRALLITPKGRKAMETMFKIHI